MKTVNSLSGGKTSSYIAANYHADYDVFALVRTDDKNCMFPDKKLSQEVEDRIQAPFVGTLEDDVIISKDFIKNIEELFADLTILDNIDMLCTCDFVYDGDDKLKLKSFRDYNKILVSKSSYFINKNMAKELYDYLDNYKYDMKTTITKFIDNNNFNVKFLNKCLFLEGSKVGIFTSSIRNKNFLSQNTNYIELVKIGSNSTITDENLKMATDIYNTIENLKNPEIYHLYGLIYYKKGDIDNAKKYLTLAANNIYIASAMIATFGVQVVDVFYVKDMFGLKLHSKSRQDVLERKLRDAIARVAERAGV